MNMFLKSALLSLIVMQAGVVVAYQPVVEDAEYKRTADQMKKAKAKVEELYNTCDDLTQKKYQLQLEVDEAVTIDNDALKEYKRVLTASEFNIDELENASTKFNIARDHLWDLVGKRTVLNRELRSLHLEIKHAEVMAELTTKFFDREVVRIESAQEPETAVHQPVVEDAEYKRTFEQMKNGNVKVQDLLVELAVVEQELSEAELKFDVEYGPSQASGGEWMCQSAFELLRKISELRFTQEALSAALQHAELMAELTTKIFDREVLRIESAAN
ncbi:MAG TPA: hypothetical protein VGT41_04020 [Candidatus Babeliales bacterium]|nr:hypothetical protein [Candidatus Babeliales bacterium]